MDAHSPKLTEPLRKNMNMKLEGTEPRYSRRIVVAYRILAAIVLVLALSLLGGTTYVLFFQDTVGSTDSPRQALSPERPSPDSGQNKQALSLNDPNDAAKVFTGIGRLRLSTAPPNPATVILSIVFLYAPEDKAFSEELASRVAEFRDIASAYMASLPAAELRGKSESDIKNALLYRYNAMLRLGQLELLYFNEYLIID
jgi:flagellar basal body-associated protein FliL